ncbi:MAG TPA: hypothetical protein VFU88_11665, partial [Ktedonobacterales bacterium]|nr:hypothetical protein [Ktedonobacterales bacterium]
MSNPTPQTPKHSPFQRPTQRQHRQRPQQAALLRLAASKLVRGPPVARAAIAILGANGLHATPGDVLSLHWSGACEALTHSGLVRPQAETSAALATAIGQSN